MTRHDPDHIRSKTTSPNFRSVLDERLSRRDLMTGSAAVAATAAIAPGFAGSVFGGEAMAGGNSASASRRCAVPGLRAAWRTCRAQFTPT